MNEYARYDNFTRTSTGLKDKVTFWTDGGC